jgi:secondary thiamine-phosphate synthase enzyme
MKSYRKELWFEVPTRRAFLNITPQVESCLRESGVREGLVLVNAMHITASVFINDDERGLHQDYEKWLEALAPHEPTSQYQHNRTGEDNADAHMKRQIMGREWWWRLPPASWTSVRGNRSSMVSSTAAGASARWSKSSVSESSIDTAGKKSYPQPEELVAD